MGDFSLLFWFPFLLPLSGGLMVVSSEQTLTHHHLGRSPLCLSLCLSDEGERAQGEKVLDVVLLDGGVCPLHPHGPSSTLPRPFSLCPR